MQPVRTGSQISSNHGLRKLNNPKAAHEAAFFLESKLKQCPHCRLPLRLAGRAYHASDEDAGHYVFLICRSCSDGLAKLPKSTQAKAANRASDRVLHDPGRYACRGFADADDAQLFCSLAGHLSTGADVIADLLA